MATAHTRWKPGQSGNPGGKPKESPELKKLKNLTKAELVEVGNLIVKANYAALRIMAKSEKATVIQRMLASVATKIIEKGDMDALDKLLNRFIGKVKDEIHHQGDLTIPPQVIITLPDNGRSAKPDDDGFGF